MKKNLRFLALGDSYTIGERVAADQRWPAQLRAALREKGFPMQEPAIIAQTGWTTTDLLAALREADLRGPFDLVTLLIGVNNQYQGLDQETYRAELRALIGLALDFAGGSPAKILGVSIPDWGVTPFNEDRDPFQIAAEIDAFNQINQKEFEAEGIQYLNITPISRLAARDDSWLAPDKLHLSGKMYAAWVELMLPIVLQILQAPARK